MEEVNVKCVNEYIDIDVDADWLLTIRPLNLFFDLKLTLKHWTVQTNKHNTYK